MSPAYFVARWLLARLLVAGVLLLWLFWHRLSAPYGSWCTATAAAGLALGLGACVGTHLAHDARTRWALLACGCLALLLLAVTIVVLTDAFCWRGYEAGDSSCAWE